MTPAAAGAGTGGPEPLVTDRAWFDRPSVAVAYDLLGSVLVHDAPDGRVAGIITEVEAYQGPEDLAAHSSRGRTARNAVLFGEPGHLYVYLIYGLHHCANVVCGPDAKPEAVLLRAATITDGRALARRRRGGVPDARLASGPGNLGAAFGLDLTLNGADLLTGPVRIRLGARAPRVRATPRIGVAYAGEWADRPLRFLIDDDRRRAD